MNVAPIDYYKQHVYDERLRDRYFVYPVSYDKPRLNVITTPKEKLIEEVKNNSSMFNPEIILQDLMLLGGSGETMEKRKFIALAAELFVRMPEDYRQDFHHYLRDNKLHHLFEAAIISNSQFHQLMEIDNKGISGLTKAELHVEKCYAMLFENDEKKKLKSKET